MKAARLHAIGDLRVEDIAAPGPPGAGEVRLTVRAAGICGSDLHNFQTGMWLSKAAVVAGHEFAGVVSAVGRDVAGIAVGDPVVADSRYWCGDCADCRAGRRNLCARLGFVGEVCDGGFAEETILPARLVVRHDPALDPAIAALAEPLAVALHAVGRLAPPPEAPVLVAGCGPIGGLVALLLSRRRSGMVLVADRQAQRSTLVAEVSGATVVDLDAGSVEAALGGGVLRHALDATGSATVIGTLAGLLAGGSTLALVGIAHARLDLDPNLLVEREIGLLGCHAFADELPEAVSLLPELADALRLFLGPEIGIDEIPEAYAGLLAGTRPGLKTIVRTV